MSDHSNDIEIELEPIAAEPIEEVQKQTQAREKHKQERRQDVTILKEVLTDLRFNTLTRKIEYGPRTSPTIMTGNDLDTIAVELVMNHDVYVPENRIRNAIRFAAEENKYCPIKRYLMDCAYAGEEFKDWDKLGKVLIGSDNPIATTVLQRFLVGAVARAYDPGCMMSWIPILIGAQGCGKSQLIRQLVPDDLFAEMTCNIETLIKEPYRLHIAWLIELPEVDNYFSQYKIEDFKNLITIRRDEVRMPYAQLPVSMQRQFVMAGTTNQSEFLVDPTGNRRFLPLEIPSGFETPWKTLHKFRDALWARAIKEYEAGFPWEVTSGEVAELASYIQQFNISDPWEEIIQEYLIDKDEVRAVDILLNALSFAPQAARPRDTKRVSEILGKMGWRRQLTTRNRKSVRLWHRPANAPKTNTSLDDF